MGPAPCALVFGPAFWPKGFGEFVQRHEDASSIGVAVSSFGSAHFVAADSLSDTAAHKDPALLRFLVGPDSRLARLVARSDFVDSRDGAYVAAAERQRSHGDQSEPERA